VSQAYGQNVVLDKGASFDETFDVIVVGTGAAGYAAAISAAMHGSSVLQLEKAGEVGGTTKKSQGFIWVPNNHFMQNAGIADPLDDFLKFVARLSRPNLYSPNREFYGLSQWEYDKAVAFYNNGASALKTLVDWDAICIQHALGIPEYHAEIPENRIQSGRVVYPSAVGQPEGHGTGESLIGHMDVRARTLGVDVRVRHEVRRLYVDDDGRATGVQVETDRSVSFGAQKAVIFASGGWAQNVDLRNNFLSGPLLGACSAKTNTGDFLPIVAGLSVELVNMNYCAMAPMVLDYAIANQPDTCGSWRIGGDSMIMVNKYGRRITDEKAMYNELARVFHAWDPVQKEYPNLVMIAVWDAAAHEQGSKPIFPDHDLHFGNPMVCGKPDQPHLLKANTIAELVSTIGKHLQQYSEYTGGVELGPHFERELHSSIERFNKFAASGVDEDFHRGEYPMPKLLSGLPRLGNTANPTMAPISEAGPYYATLMAPSALDTSGGPKTDHFGRVLRHDGTPIDGLYAVGNCAGSPFGQAYLGAGATLGPYLTNGYLAGTSAATTP
jgi:3-oxosteroid 1-dehydrogenase